jgi:hypothetical protein
MNIYNKKLKKGKLIIIKITVVYFVYINDIKYKNNNIIII